MIQPHGGKLINKVLSSLKKEEFLSKAKKLKSLNLTKDQIQEVKNIANGVYSPLIGFLREKDFKSVLLKMRLINGVVWPIPIVLDISEEDSKRLRKEKLVLLIDSDKKLIAVLKDIEIYPFSKEEFNQNVFQTLDKEHPGVAYVYKMKKYLIGGEVLLLDNSKTLFPEYNFFPSETRKIFQKRGWKTVAGFQTRNVPHRGHEFVQKEALKLTDGLFIQPVMGEKKVGDFKDEYILASYQILIDKYFPSNKVFLGILPLKMKYAGPREAALHALVRKNYGATHFIVGRDHAGVGSYYPPFAAQEIFSNFKKDEIGIEILKFPEVVYYPQFTQHGFTNSYPKAQKTSFSGTMFRNYLKEKQEPPEWFIYPEIYNFLSMSNNALVDGIYKDNSNSKSGFVLWFTGLSQAGKTTISNKVYEILQRRGIKAERLDGDIFRQYLGKDLGFSKEDRDENIRRAGYLAGLLSKNSIGVVASFISPYLKHREMAKKEAKNFIEVFCDCPLEICEKRDTKGLYQKARQGLIQHFTGISDPYERPLSPQIRLDTHKENVNQCVKKTINYLERNKLI